MKYLKILIFFKLVLFLNSCSTVKEGFKNQKKTSSDEFLVEKKSPLVMPPNFNDLPAPSEDEEISQNNQGKIKELVLKNDTQISETNDSEEETSNMEQSILKKIKN